MAAPALEPTQSDRRVVGASRLEASPQRAVLGEVRLSRSRQLLQRSLSPRLHNPKVGGGTLKMLGYIESISFGIGGYNESMFGLTVNLHGDGCGVSSFDGTWAFPPSDRAKWTEQDRRDHYADMCIRIIELLNQAKVDDVSKLKGKPVEIELDGNLLKSWRLLTEVIA